MYTPVEELFNSLVIHTWKWLFELFAEEYKVLEEERCLPEAHGKQKWNIAKKCLCSSYSSGRINESWELLVRQKEKELITIDYRDESLINSSVFYKWISLYNIYQHSTHFLNQRCKHVFSTMTSRWQYYTDDPAMTFTFYI